MNASGSQLPPPGPDCARFASLVPLLGQHLLDEPETTNLRDHIASCPHCRALAQVYATLDNDIIDYSARMERTARGADVIARSILDGHNSSDRTIRSTQRNLLMHTDSTAAPSQIHRPMVRVALTAALLVAFIATFFAARQAGIIARIERHFNTTLAPTIVPFDTHQVEISSLSMISASEGWAVGSEINGHVDAHQRDTITEESTFFYHYHQGTWQRITAPDLGQPYKLESIFMQTPANGWASGGFYNTGQRVLFHFDGNAWQRMPPPPTAMFSIAASFSATDAWGIAQGVPTPDDQTPSDQVWHLVGQTWHLQSLPAPTQDRLAIASSGFSMTSPHDGWLAAQEQISATGYHTLLFHYSDGQWALVSDLPAVSNAALAIASDGSGWMVGQNENYTHIAQDGLPSAMFLMRFQEGQWRNADTFTSSFPSTFDAGSVIARGTGDAWLIGLDNSQVQFRLLMYHFDGTSWRQFTIPQNSLTDQGNLQLAAPLSTNDIWFVDSSGGKIDEKAYFIHYKDGIWQNISAP